MGGIRLVVQGDDLGMCRAVNEGIALAVTEGILTQASAMAPTPWFAEGAALAKRLDLCVGLHVTMTCEWDFLRWSPLTPGRSLRGPDGTFHRTIADVAEHADGAETIAEANAQADRIIAAGLDIAYVDPHMNVDCVAAHRSICNRFGVKFDYRNVDPHHVWDKLIVLSVAPVEARAAWFADRLDRLEPGTHFVLTHPGVDGPELAALTSADSEDVAWAHAYRVADLDALCAPEVRTVVERKGIELISARDL